MRPGPRLPPGPAPRPWPPPLPPPPPGRGLSGPSGATAGAGLGRPGPQTLTHFPFKPSSCDARRGGRGGTRDSAILPAAAAAATTAALGHTGAPHAVPSRGGSATARGQAGRAGFQEEGSSEWGSDRWRRAVLSKEDGGHEDVSRWDVPLRRVDFIWRQWRAVRDAGGTGSDGGSTKAPLPPPAHSHQLAREVGCRENGSEARTRRLPRLRAFPPTSCALDPVFSLLQAPASAIVTS